jgi:hypothetical protein
MPFLVEKDEELRKELAFELLVAEKFWAISDNPIHVWDGIWLTQRLGAEYPGWIKEYLNTSAFKLRVEYLKYKDTGKIGREAELVGRLLGFENAKADGERRGTVSRFEERSALETDLAIYLDYQAARAAKEKPYFASDKVAKKNGISPATVKRACDRIKNALKNVSKIAVDQSL